MGPPLVRSIETMALEELAIRHPIYTDCRLARGVSAYSQW